jgi:hypothetical protein
MRHFTPNQKTETVTVRRLADGEVCVIEKLEMDSSRYELVQPVVPSAGLTLKKRVKDVRIAKS